MWVFFWFLFAVIVGVFASNRGRSGFGWFLLSLVISPLLGLLFVAVSKNLAAELQAAASRPGPESHVKCPACAEWVLPVASKCKHCGSELTPDPQFEGRKQAQKDLENKLERQQLMLGIGMLFGLFALVYGISAAVKWLGW